MANRVVLHPDGSLHGRAAPLDWLSVSHQFDLSANSVALFNNGEVYREGSLDSGGYFSFAGVDPGVYDLVSAGPSGNAAICIEVVENGSVVNQSPVIVGVGTTVIKDIPDKTSVADFPRKIINEI